MEIQHFLSNLYRQTICHIHNEAMTSQRTFQAALQLLKFTQHVGVDCDDQSARSLFQGLQRSVQNPFPTRTLLTVDTHLPQGPIQHHHAALPLSNTGFPLLQPFQGVHGKPLISAHSAQSVRYSGLAAAWGSTQHHPSFLLQQVPRLPKAVCCYELRAVFVHGCLTVA
eukprot:TRINITY_DN19009_c0_g1_i5.p1 TRINITY_DN19009_c0_g1~~TRINITY_DN19009_c0_g1_i5.p1  ORF type:complete len:168 (+),score=23.77 TRINITY_DN19009_c0_g1_i5:27-530(+)